MRLVMKKRTWLCKLFGCNVVIQRYREQTQMGIKSHCRRICTRCKNTSPCNQFLSGGNNPSRGEVA